MNARILTDTTCPTGHPFIHSFNDHILRKISLAPLSHFLLLENKNLKQGVNTNKGAVGRSES